MQLSTFTIFLRTKDEGEGPSCYFNTWAKVYDEERRTCCLTLGDGCGGEVKVFLDEESLSRLDHVLHDWARLLENNPI